MTKLTKRGWRYNMSAVLMEMARMVKERGGNVVSTLDQNMVIIANTEENVEIECYKCTEYGYLQFVLNGMFYHINMSDNPFFDFHYEKVGCTKTEAGYSVPVTNHMYVLNQAWMDPNFTAYEFGKATMWAENLLNNLVNADATESKWCKYKEYKIIT